MAKRSARRLTRSQMVTGGKSEFAATNDLKQVKQGDKMNSTTYVEEIELNVEEMEEVIAPGRGVNHNQTLASDDEEIV